MKYKDPVDLSKIIHQDRIDKIFDKNTASLCLELEKTVQEYWNVDRDSANFLNLIIKIKNVQSALEIGTSNGYSSIWLAHALKKTGGHLTTIEYFQKRADIAINNFKKAGVDDIITVIVGDAIDILADMNKNRALSFDFIFMDANKEEYIKYFDFFEPLLQKNGIIVADNISSHYKKTKNFVEKITFHPNYQTQFLNFEAGMTLSFKK